MTNDAYIISKWCQQVREKLLSIQSPANATAEIRFKHDRTGFGAQLSRRNLALRIALMTGTRVTFPEENMAPYTLPYHPLTTPIVGAAQGSIGSAAKAPNEIVDFDFWSFWEDSNSRIRVYSFLPMDCPIAGTDAQHLLDGVLLSFHCLTPYFEHKTSLAVENIKLPESYISVHFRRGDKTAETPYVPANVYRKAVLAELERLGINNVFLASDSPYARDDLNLEKAGVKVHFDETENRYNNANHRFVMEKPELAEQETLTALKNIRALSGGKAIVGQDNAHFATLAAAHIMVKNQTIRYGQLLDSRMMLQNAGYRTLYQVKGTLRSFAKALLPSRTIRSKS